MAAEPDRIYEQRKEQRLEKAAGIDDSLGIVLGHMESIDWSATPTMSNAEAASLTARLVEARDALRERGLDD